MPAVICPLAYCIHCGKPLPELRSPTMRVHRGKCFYEHHLARMRGKTQARRRISGSYHYGLSGMRLMGHRPLEIAVVTTYRLMGITSVSGGVYAPEQDLRMNRDEVPDPVEALG